jgi:D-sedoheptulose 7-phosphate isomerase
MSTDHVTHALRQAHDALSQLLEDTSTLRDIAAAGSMIATSLRADGRIFSCGNGGSMCDAMHFAEELSGRYRLDRPAYAAVSISDPSHLSCVGNDYGYEYVFSRYIEAHARAGDVLLAITTSGNSANVLRAAEAARARGAKVIGLTGRRGSKLDAHADLLIATPGTSGYADRVQELHIKVIHILIELVERELAPANYAAPTEPA